MTGLCRYKLGDIVKVAGFYNSTPELKYVCRRNVVLSINIDKNTEKDVMVAVEEATKLLAAEKLELVDFTSHVDRSRNPGHYVIFWELSSDGTGEEVLSNCCNCLDLAFVDGGYVTSRSGGGIGPLELRIVRKGTFGKILEHSISLGTAMNQFKTPRFVGSSHGKVLQILHDNVIRSYFSTAYGC